MSLLKIKPEQKSYSNQQGSIRYLDSGKIHRSITMPMPARFVLLAFFLVALAIGGYIVAKTYDTIYGSQERAKAEISQNLSRDVDYQLPKLKKYVGLGDEDIFARYDSKGVNYFISSEENEYPDGGFELVKLPADVDNAEGQELYNKGISSLKATDASLILNGMWTMVLDRSEGFNVSLRYVNFTAKDMDAAINEAMEQQGFSAKSILKEDGSGVDESGNTFKAGTVKIGGERYRWRVSVIPMEEIYDIKGMPEDAIFVGIRLTS